jgi:hypothetical protein
MARKRLVGSARALAAGVLLASVLGGTAAAQTPLTATLSGNGSGMANVTPDEEAGTVCYELTVTLDPPASAAHIHRGAEGVSGPVVVPFETPSTGTALGCAKGVDIALIGEILDNPSDFYVNVHNSAFPGGAIRGQLTE